jgi:hypothetical protein
MYRRQILDFAGVVVKRFAQNNAEQLLTLDME